MKKVLKTIALASGLVAIGAAYAEEIKESDVGQEVVAGAEQVVDAANEVTEKSFWESTKSFAAEKYESAKEMAKEGYESGKEMVNELMDEGTEESIEKQS